MRKESDFIGEIEIPDDALYGIHSVRAKMNFPDSTAFHLEWYKSMGLVKQACYITYKNFIDAVQNKYADKEMPIKFISIDKLEALQFAANKISKGEYFEHFVIPAIQGGAGTSINMNINEIITNIALQKLGYKPGQYEIIDPIEHANIYQSTNDVVPTALKVSVIQLLTILESKINLMRQEIERLEKDNRDILRIGYTQMQEAVPSSYGRLFSTYNEMFSRDWWRVSKCYERIKTVNLGGSAIGTALTVPRYFVMEVVRNLQNISQLPITRSENMSDATNNLDSFVEIHAILKAHAVNIEKMVNDIRLLSSDISAKELTIPKKQVGSSIMPGKVNPVIAEFAVSTIHRVYANDMLISSLCAQGCLDLNAYLPSIGHTILESLKLLIAVNDTIRENLLCGLVVNSEVAMIRLYYSASISTALVPYIGYNKAAEIGKLMKQKNISIQQANEELQLIDNLKLSELLKPQNLLKEGFSIEDVIKREEIL